MKKLIASLMLVACAIPAHAFEARTVDLVCEDRSLNQVQLSVDTVNQKVAYTGVDGETNEYPWNEVYQRKDWPGAPIFFVRFGPRERYWHLEFEGGRLARLQGTNGANRPFTVPCVITGKTK